MTSVINYLTAVGLILASMPLWAQNVIIDNQDLAERLFNQGRLVHQYFPCASNSTDIVMAKVSVVTYQKKKFVCYFQLSDRPQAYGCESGVDENACPGLGCPNYGSIKDTFPNRWVKRHCPEDQKYK